MRCPETAPVRGPTRRSGGVWSAPRARCRPLRPRPGSRGRGPPWNPVTGCRLPVSHLEQGDLPHSCSCGRLWGRAVRECGLGVPQGAVVGEEVVVTGLDDVWAAVQQGVEGGAVGGVL